MVAREDSWVPVVGLAGGAVVVAALASAVVVAPIFGGRLLTLSVAAWLQDSHRPVVFLLGVSSYALPWWGLRRVHGQAARGRLPGFRRRDGAILWASIGLVTLLLAAPFLSTRF